MFLLIWYNVLNCLKIFTFFHITNMQNIFFAHNLYKPFSRGKQLRYFGEQQCFENFPEPMNRGDCEYNTIGASPVHTMNNQQPEVKLSCLPMVIRFSGYSKVQRSGRKTADLQIKAFPPDTRKFVLRDEPQCGCPFY